MKNQLFNQTLLKKYSKNFKLNPSKHDLLKDYISKVEDGHFKSETKNYLYFYDVILKGVLDYKREDVLFDEGVDSGTGRSEFVLKSNEKKFMVIELKGQGIDLDKRQSGRSDNKNPVEQAFGYAINTGDVDWIMVSNYEEFRLYNYYEKTKFISFNVDELLDKKKFAYFMLSFSRESHIESDYITKVREDTLVVDRKLASEFYKLYNETRLMLIKELESESQMERLDAIHYAQLILNRYMFICFAEDTGLLPSQISVDTISTPILKGNIRHRSIWQRLNELCLDINEGNEFKKINEYNGGLFSEDLDFIKIRDIVEDQTIFKNVYQDWNFTEYEKDISHLLGKAGHLINPIYRNMLTISSFDFSTELDVNILGHIFENSIGDIEELKEDIKGRRKKEGIFYTPDYITDYICKNTIIPYLSKSGDVNTVDKLLKEYWGSKIEELDQKVKEIKIVDPACGSGAFLNKASDVLLEIHQKIHETRYKDKKDTLIPYFDSIEQRREILLNNIYGVDLNIESVEITKLSLFLKVCRKGLKLPNLEKNIKSGNSLIDNPEYTDKPFKWEQEFSEIFDESGFDVVIGNPPYVRIQTLNFDKNMVKYFKDTYKSAIGNYDIYNLFIEKSLNLVKEKHEIGFISPNKFILADYGIGLRNIINNSFALKSIINFLDNQIFEGASTYTCLLFLKKNIKKFKYAEIKQFDNAENIFNIIDRNEEYDDGNISIGVLESEKHLKPQWNFYVGKSAPLMGRLMKITLKLDDIVEKIFQGLATSADKIYIVEAIRDLGNLFEVYSQETKAYHLIEKDMVKKVIKGKETKKYGFDYKNRYLIHPYILNETDYMLIESGTLEKNYPHAWEYLKLNEKKIRARERGKMDNDKWYAFTYPKSMLDYRNKKIMTPNSAFNASFAYDTNGEYHTTTGVAGGFAIKLKNNNKFNEWYLLTILNSSLMNFFNKKIGKSLQGGFYSFEGRVIKNYPLIEINEKDQLIFIQKAQRMSFLVSKFIEEINNFKEWLKYTYNIDKLTKKLDKYYELIFDEFLDEVRKKKVDVNSRENYQNLKSEFEESIQIINPLLQEIEKTNNEIDVMVYELYGLTDEEIQIIEESLEK